MSDLSSIINDLALGRSTPQELARAHDLSIAELANALAAPEHRKTLNNIARLNAMHRQLYLDQIKLNVLAKLFDIAHSGGGLENHATAAHSRMLETMRKACVDLLRLGEARAPSSRAGTSGGGGGRGGGGRGPHNDGPPQPPQRTEEQQNEILDALEQLGREWDDEDARRFGTDEYVPRYQNPHRQPPDGARAPSREASARGSLEGGLTPDARAPSTAVSRDDGRPPGVNNLSKILIRGVEESAATPAAPVARLKSPGELSPAAAAASTKPPESVLPRQPVRKVQPASRSSSLTSRSPPAAGAGVRRRRFRGRRRAPPPP